MQVSGCPGKCTCYKRFIPSLIKVSRAGVERLYCYVRGVLLDHLKSEIPTYKPTTDPEPTSEALKIWDGLARALNITEKGLRAKWKQEKQCGNARCLKRGKIGGEDVEKKLRHVCRRCSSVWYCGKECQRECVFIKLFYVVTWLTLRAETGKQVIRSSASGHEWKMQWSRYCRMPSR